MATRSIPQLISGAIDLEVNVRIRLPEGFASGESISCWTVDGRLLGRVQPSAEGLWKVPYAWRQHPGLRYIRRDADGQALPMPVLR